MVASTTSQVSSRLGSMAFVGSVGGTLEFGCYWAAARSGRVGEYRIWDLGCSRRRVIDPLLEDTNPFFLRSFEYWRCDLWY